MVSETDLARDREFVAYIYGIQYQQICNQCFLLHVMFYDANRKPPIPNLFILINHSALLPS